MTNLAWNVERVLPSAIADLHRLISIPSISSMPEHDADVAACADVVSGLFRDLGASEVKLLDGGGKPAVWANFPGPEGSPTVLLYAHYDVQPTGDADAWTSPAFEPTERDGRLYARGSADDKGGVALHVAALRVFNGKPPVGVKVFIEGEEEVGSPSMPTLLDRYRDELAADVYVVADSVNWEVGKPSLTTSLRGVAACEVTVSTLAEGLHSGQFGGVVPDALTALCRLLATLHDEAGNVAIEGLVSGTAPDLDYPEDRLQEETGLLEGVSQTGDGSVVERMWFKPSASVLAIDATPVAKASNTLVPSARAKVSVRLAPGQDPAAAARALEEHLRSNAPWGARVEIDSEQVRAFREAFGVDAVEIGCGGSIPIVAEFADRNPGALVLVTAVTDPNSRMHGIDESLDLGDFAKAALAETLLLNNLAG